MTAGAPRVLCVRLDSAGDVLVTGPAVRAVAAGASSVVLLAGPQGAAAARLLPGVDEVLVWTCPWIVGDAPAVDPADVADLVARVAALEVDEAVVFTSFHQSALPTALLLRLAGVANVSATSTDYPGSLLDVRHQVDEAVDVPEPERHLALAAAAGFALPAGDDGRLALRHPLPELPAEVAALTADPYVVLHPGASVPARAWTPQRCAEAVELLADAGWRVLVTGTAGERELTRTVAGTRGTDLGGATSLGQTARLLAGAAAVVVGNTGPAHLAAAVGTPVVSLFAPTVPAQRWAPYAVETVLLGDQDAPCRGSRARVCPVPGHPCLAGVSGADVVAAVEKLGGSPVGLRQREGVS
ncbi:ADP-heptose:LPS heptosyltransferase [Motilibacter rhizosphaerae]|uniref:ADP-heptose:LPS heptosyltransferase n=1 Tax=Motilibacter rhizosphaerae TaxID=598652 RepID=A0A4V2F3D6_9ACTN|nr:glycosyltransferase family 9 protein [Motilibacter rhizosphaerae]RZS82743.1 ADP-heptose:LPS heptosyltransferase [Motilibacter rhizosphaerae]